MADTNTPESSASREAMNTVPLDDVSELGSFDSPDPFQALLDTFVTVDGDALADVLAGIRTELHQTNKILYKISTQLDSR